MNRPHFFRSFLSSQLSGSKPLTSPAKRVAYRDASKSVMGATPERPLRIPFHVSSVPMPSGDTSPMPVTTTRRRGRVGRPSGWLIANSPFDLRDHRVRFVHSLPLLLPTGTTITPSGPTRPCKRRCRRLEDFIRQLWIVHGARKNEGAN